MECKEFEKLIPDFIDHKLDYKTLEQFNKHRKQCENCNEELVIRFLMTEGIQRLEEGDSFDLQTELDRYMEESEKKVRKHRKIMDFLLAAVGLSIVAITVIIVYFFYSGI